MPRTPALLRTPPLSRKTALGLTLAFLVLFSGVFIARATVFPRVSTITYRFDGKEAGTGQNPLFVKSEGDHLFLRFSLFLPVGLPTTFKIKPDDCIDTLTINGKDVSADKAKYCDYTVFGRSLDLSEYLKKGENTFVVRLRDTGGKAGIRVTPHYTSLPFLLLNHSPLFLVVLYVALILWPFMKRSKDRSLWMIGIGGALLRIFYFLVTPPATRAHDMKAHLDYILYVAKHWSMPPASDGWEFHQAPLYYFLSALWAKTGELIRLSEEGIARVVQFQSLLFSLLALVIGIWIGSLLFGPKERTERILFSCLLAAFPSLIYHTVSVNNNSLYVPLVFLLTALLIRWWRKPTARRWYLLTLVLALAFVTRVSALLFVPVIGFSLLFQDQEHWRAKVRLGALSSILFLLLAGWLPLVRLAEKNPTNSFTFNSQAMNSKLSVPTDARTFLTFNPIRVLSTPYANPWKDTTPREYFWEYFFRSAFFGEFSYPDELRAVAVLILASALLLLPFLAYALVLLTLRYSHIVFPLGLITIFVVAAHLFYRIFAPFSANQDFRFSLAVIPPVLYYLVWGIRSGPHALRSAGTYIAVALSSLMAVFVVLLGFFAP